MAEDRSLFFDLTVQENIRLGLTGNKTERAAAGLVKDLKQRGMLDSTVVHWGGEMGRLPVIQNDAGRDRIGRDHNTYGFTMWLAGGGVKPGITHGKTDELGLSVEEGAVGFSTSRFLMHTVPDGRCTPA